MGHALQTSHSRELIARLFLQYLQIELERRVPRAQISASNVRDSPRRDHARRQGEHAYWGKPNHLERIHTNTTIQCRQTFFSKPAITSD